MKKNFKKRLFQYVIGKMGTREDIVVPVHNERLATRDELFELYKSGLITELDIEPLLRGEEISTDMYS